MSLPERVSGLVLIGTAARMAANAPQLFGDRAALVEAEGVEVLVQSAIQRWFPPEFIARSPAIGEYVTMLRDNHAYGYAAACRSLCHFDVRDRLSAIRCPTPVPVGDQDAATPPELSRQLAAGIPDASYESSALPVTW